MGRERKRKQNLKSRTSVISLIEIVIFIILIALALTVLPKIRDTKNGKMNESEVSEQSEVLSTEEEESNAEESETEESGLSFPIVLDNGLEVTSLFPYDGINPDCNNEEGKSIASITVNNQSGMYLSEATIQLALSDGTVTNFSVTDLPAEKSALVFSKDNISVSTDTTCIDIRSDANFDENIQSWSDTLEIITDGMSITVTNISGKDISEIVLYCRSPLGDDYWGGITYQYKIKDLPANETTTIEAIDCILGIVEVVRVEIQ